MQLPEIDVASFEFTDFLSCWHLRLAAHHTQRWMRSVEIAALLAKHSMPLKDEANLFVGWSSPTTVGYGARWNYVHNSAITRQRSVNPGETAYIMNIGSDVMKGSGRLRNKGEK